MLSERSEAFEAGFARWTATLAPSPTISARELRFVAQTLVATWPLDPREHDDLELRLSELPREGTARSKGGVVVARARRGA